jgi:hypothetical protein
MSEISTRPWKIGDEIWLPLKGYEGLYEGSNWGRIKSLRRTIKTKDRKQKTVKESILNPSIDGAGYYSVTLQPKDGHKKITQKLHRLIANTFIPNPENLPQLNHIDGNKINNYVSNLEWCTNKENSHHREQLLCKATSKPVDKLTMDGELIVTYPSAIMAATKNNVSRWNIYRCCNGKDNVKDVGGFVYRWHNSTAILNDEEEKLSETDILKKHNRIALDAALLYKSRAEKAEAEVVRLKDELGHIISLYCDKCRLEHTNGNPCDTCTVEMYRKTLEKDGEG